MNISESNELNVLLRWLFELPPGKPVTHERGMEAAAYLAERSQKALHAGLGPDDVREHWHWADDPRPAKEAP